MQRGHRGLCGQEVQGGDCVDTAPVTPPPAPPPPQLQPALVRARLARPSSEAATEARKRRPGSRTTRASRDTVHTEPGLLGEAEVDRIDI